MMFDELKPGVNAGRFDWLERITLAVFLCTVFLAPPIYFSPSLPAFAASDLLLPVMTFIVLYRYGLSPLKRVYIRLLLLLAVFIIITMAVNHRLGQYRDYFEVFKVLKFAIGVLFVAATVRTLEVMKLMRGIFIALLVFNALQYTGAFNFNNTVEPYYSTDLHLSGFGLNSLGEPASRRMFGTMGNPNNNAILFLFFAVLFIPGKITGKYDRILFFITYLCILLCQSRTGFIAFGVILIGGAVLFRFALRTIIAHLVMLPLLYLVFMSIDALYLGKIFDIRMGGAYLGTLANGNTMQSGSVNGRLMIWGKLWQMIKTKPLFGHAPYKEYFYDNNLYAESEYVLVTWRYGFLGVIIYVASLVYPAWLAFRKAFDTRGKQMFLAAAFLLVACITNTPMYEPSINMMYAFMVGFFFAPRILNGNADEKASAGGQ